jgi:hypothetical protein
MESNHPNSKVIALQAIPLSLRYKLPIAEDKRIELLSVLPALGFQDRAITCSGNLPMRRAVYSKHIRHQTNSPFSRGV